MFKNTEKRRQLKETRHALTCLNEQNAGALSKFLDIKITPEEENLVLSGLQKLTAAELNQLKNVLVNSGDIVSRYGVRVLSRKIEKTFYNGSKANV